jgi:hypothetical protein
MVSIAENRRKMEEHAAHSHILYRNANAYIAVMLGKKISRTEMVQRLRVAAGPAKRGEPCWLRNIRRAADQLERGELICVI